MLEAWRPVLCGGHLSATNEPKYGLSVTGLYIRIKILANTGAKAGDLLIFTKKLGTGMIVAAKNMDMDSENGFLEAAASMTLLNKYACEAMDGFCVQPHRCDRFRFYESSYRNDGRLWQKCHYL